MIEVGVGDDDGHTGGEGRKLNLFENGLVVGFVDDAAGAVEVDFGAVNAMVFAEFDGDRAVSSVGGEGKGHFNITGEIGGVVAAAVVGEETLGGFSEAVAIEIYGFEVIRTGEGETVAVLVDIPGAVGVFGLEG